jgi:hypothetical protein
MSLSKFPNLIRNHNDGPGYRFPEKFGSGSTKLVDHPSTELCKKNPEAVVLDNCTELYLSENSSRHESDLDSTLTCPL